MSDVDKVPGPSGPPPQPPERRMPSAQFGEVMKKVKGIEKSDSEQKKKRKRREEVVEEDINNGNKQAGVKGAAANAPFFAQEAQGPTLPQGSGATPPATPSDQPPPPAAADDNVAETFFPQGALPPTPSSITPTPAEATTTPTDQKKESEKPKSKGKIVSFDEALQMAKKGQGKRPEEMTPDGMPITSQPGAAAFTPLEKKEEALKKTEAGTKKEMATPQAQPTDVTPSALPTVPLAATTPPSYAYLHPIVQQMFDRMVGTIQVMMHQGVQETTITLNPNPSGRPSILEGTQVVIREFSTAPRAYNIELLGSAQAVSVMQENLNDLFDTFNKANYNFKVQKIDVYHLQGKNERRLVKRKEQSKEGEST